LNTITKLRLSMQVVFICVVTGIFSCKKSLFTLIFNLFNFCEGANRGDFKSKVLGTFKDCLIGQKSLKNPKTLLLKTSSFASMVETMTEQVKFLVVHTICFHLINKTQLNYSRQKPFGIFLFKPT
jgi:hypothetical protein